MQAWHDEGLIMLHLPQEAEYHTPHPTPNPHPHHTHTHKTLRQNFLWAIVDANHHSSYSSYISPVVYPFLVTQIHLHTLILSSHNFSSRCWNCPCASAILDFSPLVTTCLTSAILDFFSGFSCDLHFSDFNLIPRASLFKQLPVLESAHSPFLVPDLLYSLQILYWHGSTFR